MIAHQSSCSLQQYLGALEAQKAYLRSSQYHLQDDDEDADIDKISIFELKGELFNLLADAIRTLPPSEGAIFKNNYEEIFEQL